MSDFTEYLLTILRRCTPEQQALLLMEFAADVNNAVLSQEDLCNGEIFEFLNTIITSAEAPFTENAIADTAGCHYRRK